MGILHEEERNRQVTALLLSELIVDRLVVRDVYVNADSREQAEAGRKL